MQHHLVLLAVIFCTDRVKFKAKLVIKAKIKDKCFFLRMLVM